VAKKRDPLSFLDSYGALKRCLDALCTEAYAANELSPAEGKILRYVAENPGTSQADLARATCADAALTGRALQPLLDRGWIERQRSDQDKREYVLSLVAPGRPALKRVGIVRAKLAQHVAARLTQRDLQDFDRIVEKLSAVAETPPLPKKPALRGMSRRS
jgi:DNA-binding MarR family transcriptional regulator